jgi:hypothetical protein
VVRLPVTATVMMSFSICSSSPQYLKTISWGKAHIRPLLDISFLYALPRVRVQSNADLMAR